VEAVHRQTPEGQRDGLYGDAHLLRFQGHLGPLQAYALELEIHPGQVFAQTEGERAQVHVDLECLGQPALRLGAQRIFSYALHTEENEERSCAQDQDSPEPSSANHR